MDNIKRCACSGIRHCLLCDIINYDHERNVLVKSPLKLPRKPKLELQCNGRPTDTAGTLRGTARSPRTEAVQSHENSEDDIGCTHTFDKMIYGDNSTIPMRCSDLNEFIYCLACTRIHGMQITCREDSESKYCHASSSQILKNHTDLTTVMPDTKLPCEYQCTGIKEGSNETKKLMEIDGIAVIENFILSEEESYLVKEIDSFPWKLSQSGRRKQDFGPKANFKKKKVNIGNFNGLPHCCEFIVKRMKSLELLHTFEPVEVCHLEYKAERGSSIDPHIDDQWLWGERLVTLNLLNGSILCLTHDDYPEIIVRIPMPARSLLILQGEARHKWKHSIGRKDIYNTRIAVTFRELADTFQSGGTSEIIGQKISCIANCFHGNPLYNGVSEQF